MSLELRVQVFARLREQLGADHVTIRLLGQANVGSLRSALGERLPKESLNLIRVSAVAVNGEYASDDASLKASDEIALIPPVSGGQ